MRYTTVTHHALEEHRTPSNSLRLTFGRISRRACPALILSSILLLPLAGAADLQNYYQPEHAAEHTASHRLKNIRLYASGKCYTIKLTNLPDGSSEFSWVRLEIFESRSGKLRMVWSGKERLQFPICRVRLHRYRDGTVFVSAAAESRFGMTVLWCAPKPQVRLRKILEIQGGDLSRISDGVVVEGTAAKYVFDRPQDHGFGFSQTVQRVWRYRAKPAKFTAGRWRHVNEND